MVFIVFMLWLLANACFSWVWTYVGQRFLLWLPFQVPKSEVCIHIRPMQRLWKWICPENLALVQYLHCRVLKLPLIVIAYGFLVVITIILSYAIIGYDYYYYCGIPSIVWYHNSNSLIIPDDSISYISYPLYSQICHHIVGDISDISIVLPFQKTLVKYPISLSSTSDAIMPCWWNGEIVGRYVISPLVICINFSTTATQILTAICMRKMAI